MITTSEVKTRVEKFYPDNLHGESFNDGDLGGCNVFGDPATHYPIMWKHLVKKFDIKTVIDIGCGFGYTVDYFKKHLNLEVVGVEGSKKVKELALNTESIFLHDYSSDGALQLPTTYDLAWSTEFVEHVEAQYLDNFFATFKCAKYLAFTYAYIKQLGHHHVNENTEEYWIKEATARGFSYDEQVTKELREKTLEDWRDPRSPVDQSKVEDWNAPYHFATRGLFFKNDLLL
tara:strand:+ start:591 stop:1283 length:693 start_codon:yes stop_codon:yes gene_type:complete